MTALPDRGLAQREAEHSSPDFARDGLVTAKLRMAILARPPTTHTRTLTILIPPSSSLL
jgi:hypothetical protein